MLLVGESYVLLIEIDAILHSRSDLSFLETRKRHDNPDDLWRTPFVSLFLISIRRWKKKVVKRREIRKPHLRKLEASSRKREGKFCRAALRQKFSG